MKGTYLFAGASSAIALEAARLLKEKGNTVIGISTKKTLEGYDSFYDVEKYTFGSFPQIEEPVAGVVYFAGTINLKPFARFTGEEFTRDLEVNTLGAVAFVQAYLSNLKKSPASSIVLISSVAASTGLPFHTSIALAKGALEGFAKALAAELAPGIRVNCIAPSLVNTPMGKKFVDTPEKMEQMQKRNPLRHVGEAADVAHAVCYLLGEEAKWVSGQTFAIDGGMGTIKN